MNDRDKALIDAVRGTLQKRDARVDAQVKELTERFRQGESNIDRRLDLFERSVEASVATMEKAAKERLGALIAERANLLRNTATWLDRCLEGAPA